MICPECKGSGADVFISGDSPYGPSEVSSVEICEECNGTGEVMNNNYIDPRKVTLSELVKDNKKVYFSYYRDKEFWYKHENGLLFPVPLKDVDDPASRATLLAEDKALYFMRWLKKYLSSVKDEADTELDEVPNPNIKAPPYQPLTEGGKPI